MKSDLRRRSAALILAGIAIITPCLFYAAGRAVQSNSNKVIDWLPKTYVETGDLRWFRQHFVGDQFVVISWDGCRLGGDPREKDSKADDPRLERLARTLVSSEAWSFGPAGVRSRKTSGTDADRPYFKSVTTGRRLLERLTSPPMNVPYDVAVQRLKGGLIGPDGRQTCVVVTLADEVLDNLEVVLGRGHRGWFRQRPEGVLFQALRACEIDPKTVHLGGPPVDNVAIDEEGERTLLRLAGLAGLIVLLLAWCSLRSAKLTWMVLACGVLSGAASLAAVWLTGETTDAVLLSMPSLVYVLAISGAVHLINYYREAVNEVASERAPARALAHGWKPVLFCSTTTALGLLSLCASDLTPIRRFGMYSALGMMLMLVVLFVFLPAAWQLWPTRRRIVSAGTPDGGSTPHAPRASASLAEGDGKPTNGDARGSNLWSSCGQWIIQRHVWVSVVCLAFVVGMGFGVPQVRSNVDLMKLFDSEARILQDYKWLEAGVGRLVPIEIVLRFARPVPHDAEHTSIDHQHSLLERAKTVAAVQQAIEARFGSEGEDIVGPAISALTFVPPLPKTGGGTSGVLGRSVTVSRLERGYAALLDSGYLATDKQDGAELWRVSVRVAAFEDVDYGRFVGELRSVVEPVVAKYNRQLATHVSGTSALQRTSDRHDVTVPSWSVVYTGVIPIIYKAQRALLESLIESTFWSFVTITPLLMFVSRGVLAGIVAMLPNVLPVLVVFGGMGWLGLPVDIGSMMSASIALGVAVDDTIHYLTWFREELNRSGDRHRAILAAYRRCARPTLQAALINGLGLSVFAFSTFTPTKHFGYLMLTILLAGAVAELVLLPALLAGPLGRAFRPRQRTVSRSDPPPEP